MNYLDFDLAIEAVASTSSATAPTYRARVLNSPAGQATVDFTLPFNAHELENYILKMGRPRRTVRSLTQEGEAARELGARLYNAVFQGDVRDALRGSLMKAGEEGLRLRLRLGDAPALLDLPWEYLYDPTLRRFFCHSVATPLVRYPEQPRPVTPLAVTLPLQLLVMIANPSDVSALDVEGEWQKIRSALAPLEAQGQVQLTRLPNATLATLQRQLRQGSYHIFHFVGHGGVSPINGERILYLEDERGRARLVSGDVLGTLLNDHRSLRLALLNACEGARVGTNDPFAGVAQHLVLQGIPAIIAMQFEITDDAAILLAQEFYAALADGYPVEAALAEARKAIFVAGHEVEWGTPVLYSRASDGYLFMVASTRSVEQSVATLAPTTLDTQSTTDVQSASSAIGDSQTVKPTDHVSVTAETYGGIPVGFTAEGYLYRGSLNAPITIYEFMDFQCPFCSRYFIQTEPALDRSYVRNAIVRVVFRNFPLVELHPNAPAAHIASLCVAEQSAALYWAIHARLFETQSEWNQLSDPTSYFAKLAMEVGIDILQYQACIANSKKEAVVAQHIAEAHEKGFSGTPSFQFVREATKDAFALVGAHPYDQFASMINTLIAGGTPQPITETQGNNGTPFWATAEGLRPNLDRPGQTIAGDSYRGNPDAKVVVIEFSDFQCPFCRKHTLETQSILDEKFVDTNQVLWVFKHFPLTTHPQARAAAIAAECAAEQGKFWAMHERLFNTTLDWSVNDPTSVLTDLAQQLKLNVNTFITCLEGEEVAKRVQEDLEAGTPFVRGTPTFIVLCNGKGSIIPGALPEERFSSFLQGMLDTIPQ